MKTTVTTLIVLLGLAQSALPAPETFNFKDPKGVNNVAFNVDAPLEAVNGNASGVSGTVTFDPDHPESIHGEIVVASASLRVPNSMQQQHMHSDKWLDVAQYPEITFVSKELKGAKTQGNVTTAEAVGTFTLKGVSKELTIPVKLTYLKDKLGDRVPGLKGDLLVIRSNFTINRNEFNIAPHQFEDKVSDEITLTLSIAGAAAR